MRVTSLLTAIFACVLAGCATGPEAEENGSFFRYDGQRDVASYSKIYLVPPVAGRELQARVEQPRLSRFSSSERLISQRDLDRKLADLEAALRRELSKEAELVDAQGPGVLVIQTALMDLEANLRTQAEMRANPGLNSSSVAGGAASVIYGLSVDGERIATIFDRNQPVRLPSGLAAGGGLWGTADRFFVQTAKRLGALFED